MENVVAIPLFCPARIPEKNDDVYKQKIPGIKDLEMDCNFSVLFCKRRDRGCKTIACIANSKAPFYKISGRSYKDQGRSYKDQGRSYKNIKF